MRSGAAWHAGAGPGTDRPGQVWLSEVRPGKARLCLALSLTAGGGTVPPQRSDGMKTYRVKIEGISPLIMHRLRTSFGFFRPAPLECDPRATAEECAYRLPPKNGREGALYVPAEHLERAIREAAGLHKIGRRSAPCLLPDSLFIRERRISLRTRRYRVHEYRVDIRGPHGDAILYLPRLDEWRLVFHLDVDAPVLTKALVLAILRDAGKRTGAGQFRPQPNGVFGRFIVTEMAGVPGRACRNAAGRRKKGR